MPKAVEPYHIYSDFVSRIKIYVLDATYDICDMCGKMVIQNVTNP